jgi:hypothetical protein
MSVYDLHFNKDDVTIRNILIGFLATLHDSIQWYNQIGVNIEDRRLIKVPFYFSTTGTERYLQDNFLNNIDFDPELLQAETFYNQIPRGIADLQSIAVDGTAIVNKYVRMQHQKQELDGTLRTYSSEAFMVPITFNMECTVYTDSIIDQLKCTESVIKTFFKNKVFQVDIAYTRIPCLAVFPDDYENERSIEFSFTDKREFKTTFSIQVKAHIPVYKEGTEIFAGNTMESFGGTAGYGHIYVPPIIYGSTALNSNDGSPEASGAIGATYSSNPPNQPAWPIVNPSPFPPNGGATSYQP